MVTLKNELLEARERFKKIHEYLSQPLPDVEQARSLASLGGNIIDDAFPGQVVAAADAESAIARLERLAKVYAGFPDSVRRELRGDWSKEIELCRERGVL